MGSDPVRKRNVGAPRGAVVALLALVIGVTGCSGSTADRPHSADDVAAAFAAHDETLVRLYEARAGEEGAFVVVAEGIEPPVAAFASQGNEAKTYYQVLVFASEEDASAAIARAPDEMARVGRVTALQKRNVVAFVPVDGLKRDVVESALHELGG